MNKYLPDQDKNNINTNKHNILPLDMKCDTEQMKADKLKEHINYLSSKILIIYICSAIYRYLYCYNSVIITDKIF